jgi:hypothetical protein
MSLTYIHTYKHTYMHTFKNELSRGHVADPMMAMGTCGIDDEREDYHAHRIKPKSRILFQTNLLFIERFVLPTSIYPLSAPLSFPHSLHIYAHSHTYIHICAHTWFSTTMIVHFLVLLRVLQCHCFYNHSIPHSPGVATTNKNNDSLKRWICED